MGKHEIPPSNKGYKMLASMGWKAGEGLGVEKQGRKDPVPTCFKRDRAGLGKKKLHLRVTHSPVVTLVTKPTPPPQPKLTVAEKSRMQQEKAATEKKHTSYARDLYGDMLDGYEEYFQ